MVIPGSHAYTLMLVALSFCVEHKHAANVGGSDHQNLLLVESTLPPLETTTPFARPTTPGLYVTSGANNFTVQAGTKVTLHCQVDYLAENTTVSWLRRFGDSLTLVSVGTEVYSSDKRYASVYLNQKDWQLNIDGVNLTDQGYYECQISSHPPIVRSVYLHVVVPVLEIADERSLPIKNKFYNSGSTIELKCVITKVPQPTQFIIWTHNSSILNYDTTRGGIRVSMTGVGIFAYGDIIRDSFLRLNLERRPECLLKYIRTFTEEINNNNWMGVKTDILPDGAKSQLQINNVGPSDSGNYTCSLGEAAVTSVSVVVITGETPAAMQHGCATSQVSAFVILMATAVLCRYLS